LDKGKKEQETKSEYTNLVPAVDQAARILICLAKSQSSKINLTDICRSVGIHKSKGYSILSTLQRFGFVQRNSAGKTYSLGLGLISLSRKVLDSLDYGAMAGPFLEILAKKTHSTALFGINNDRNVFIVAKSEGDRNFGVTIRTGHRFSITSGAHGKAIVAFMPEEDRKAIMKQKKLYFHGEDFSKLDRKRLEIELARCREDGFAVDLGGLKSGVKAIASPVFDSEGRIIGSLLVIGTFPETLVREYGSMTAENAKQFSFMLGADIEQTFGRSGKTDSENAHK
jgi:DNA-binding IclR family transcriptional regulator